MTDLSLSKLDIPSFLEVLASHAPVPGGGGASALVGALGTALGNMVGSLTVGKAKYADVQDEIVSLKAEATTLQAQFLSLIELDAQAFEPLSKAYGLPRQTEEEKAHRATVMEAALRTACQPPMEIMRCCCKAIRLHERFGQIGTAIAISDVGVGVALCQAALKGASLNVFINTKSMTDREYAERCNQEANQMLQDYIALADRIYASVQTKLR